MSTLLEKINWRGENYIFLLYVCVEAKEEATLEFSKSKCGKRREVGSISGLLIDDFFRCRATIGLINFKSREH
jgi:hypothetical protein